MQIEPSRAGFWRRMFSLFIDAILVFLPFQIIAAILFSLTAGLIQFSAGGITTTACFKATSVPNDLKPPPPVNANTAEVCKQSFFGAETARLLTVSRVTKQGNVTYTVSETYALDSNNKVINAWSLNWLAYLVLLTYLITLKMRKNGTLGDRITKISVVDNSLKTGLPPPLKQMAIRYGVLLGPFLVTAAIIQALAKLGGGSAENLSKYHYFAVGLTVIVPSLIYYFICLVQIVRKTDPYWDRLAATAVLTRVAK